MCTQAAPSSDDPRYLTIQAVLQGKTRTGIINTNNPYILSVYEAAMQIPSARAANLLAQLEHKVVDALPPSDIICYNAQMIYLNVPVVRSLAEKLQKMGIDITFGFRPPQELLEDIRALQEQYSREFLDTEEATVLLHPDFSAAFRLSSQLSAFLEQVERCRIVVDAENASAPTFISALSLLTDTLRQRIDLINVYTNSSCPNSWEALPKSAQVPVSLNYQPRLLDRKSVNDLNVVQEVCVAQTQGCDSVILVSSDSDFWTVIRKSPLRFFVLAEQDKTNADYLKQLARFHISCNLSGCDAVC